MGDGRRYISEYFQALLRGVWSGFGLTDTLIVVLIVVAFLAGWFTDTNFREHPPAWLIACLAFLLIIFEAFRSAYQIYAVERERALRLERQLARSDLTIQFDPDNIDECTLDEGKGWIQFRMKITNTCGKTIHNCLGELARVKSSLLSRPYVEKVPLTWARMVDITALEIHNGATRLLNVIQIYDGRAGVPPKAQFISPADANNPIHPFEQLGSYDCTVTVSGEETNSKYVSFTFNWTGNRTASIRNVRVSDYDSIA